MAEITVVGGINIDIEGSPFQKLTYEDSNPGQVTMAYGGVGRNITENIARTGGNVAMISVIGDDYMGQGAKRELEQLGVDVHGIETIKGRNSAMYLSILNHNRDMELALCDMDILEHLTGETIDKHLRFLRNSKVVALDGNLDEELLSKTVEKLDGVKLFFDPVSSKKAIKAKKHIGRFYAIKPNKLEAEVLSGMSIENEDDLRSAAAWFLGQGVKQVYITLNKEGVYYKDAEKEGVIRPGQVNLVSATGAGDSFSAMILMGIAGELDIEETARYGMAAASIAMESQSAVNQKICKEEILRRIQNV